MSNHSITYKNETVAIRSEESVLDALENAGHAIPYSCRAGLCQSCMMQADETPPPSAQQGLSESQKLQHFFLACSCFPKADMKVNLIGDTNQIKGVITEKTLLNETVLKLCIQVDFNWFAGQYTSVWFDDIQGRSYSIANRCTNERILELHIKRHDMGLVSRWLHDEKVVGDTIVLSKPLGNCFYSDTHADKPILMASTGTGLAPLYGIVQEALYRHHNAPIVLYAGAGEPKDLYYVDELTRLAAENEQFEYIPVVRRNPEQFSHAALIESDVVNIVQENYTDLNGWKIFLCGSPDMIKKVQRHCFFQGAAVTDILVDAFVIEKPAA